MAAFLRFASPPRIVAMAASTVSGDMASAAPWEAMTGVWAGDSDSRQQVGLRGLMWLSVGRSLSF